MMIRKSGMIGYRIRFMSKKNNNHISYYKNKNILITGGVGYLGASIINALSHISCKITVLDIRDNVLKLVDGQVADILLKQGDIKNKDVWLEYLKGIDIVFHFAAQTSSYIANENPAKDLEINLLPAVSLIETCYKNKLRPDIIFAGTVTEAGLTDILPVSEAFKDQPVTVYDINKLAAEKYIQYYSNQMGGRSVVLRLANVYGPGPASSSADRGILNLMIRKALKGEDLTIYGEGNFIRDYVYIDDVIKAFLIAGANMNGVKGNYYVIGSRIGHSIKYMVHAVKVEVGRRTGKEVKISHIQAPDNFSPIESRNFIANTTVFTNITGWVADVSLREGINMTIDFFLKEART